MANRAPKGYDSGDIAGLKASFTGGRLSSFNDYNPMNFEDYAESWDDSVDEGELIEDDEFDSRPVELTDIPTSSTDAGRPRTVAAGYRLYAGARRNPRDQQLGKMTVMFRDGTLYNYYDVTPGEWQNFRNSISKGAPWLNKGFPNGKQKVDGLFIGKRQGPADISAISDKARSDLYRIARTAQVRFQNPRAVQVNMGNRTETFRGTVPKSVRRKAGLTKAKNPSKGGVNPYKP